MKKKSDPSLQHKAKCTGRNFMEDKAVKGSLARALELNSQADSNHVPTEIRKEIADKLRARYLERHPKYKEPDK